MLETEAALEAAMSCAVITASGDASGSAICPFGAWLFLDCQWRPSSRLAAALRAVSHRGRHGSSHDLFRAGIVPSSSTAAQHTAAYCIPFLHEAKGCKGLLAASSPSARSIAAVH